MHRKILNAKWFARPALQVAPDLVGKVLVRKFPQGIERYRITEVEAYCGVQDLACHAAKGRTRRTEVMFGPAGRIYVYLIYGMYHCLNLVTAGKGEAEAVLIRSVEPLSSTLQKPIGPGRLCRELNIGSEFNCHRLNRISGLWVEDDGYIVKPEQMGQSARRGITYAKDYASKPWRFYLKTSKFVS
ncbi:MAG: DNA-3-methyladenine glycosylase [Patescibacteria group bacterium]|jgi:DNA-3-methyladenine glycosylase